MLILRSPWHNQPQYIADIDWSNPLTRGLTVVMVPGRSFAVGTTGARTVAQSGTNNVVVPLSEGLALYEDGNGDISSEISCAAGSGPKTEIWLGSHTNPGAGYKYISGNYSGSAGNGIQIFNQDLGGRRLSYFNGGTINSGVNLTSAATDIQLIGVSAPSHNGTHSFYIDGALVASVSGAVGGATPDTSTSPFVCASIGKGQSAFRTLSSTLLGAKWLRELSASEIAELHRNPWQLFESRRIFIPVSVAGGGNVTLALTGVSTTLSPGTLGVSVAGTQALTGQSSTLSAGTVTASVSTSVALSGAASTLSPGTVAASITVALTGTAITASPGTVSAGADVTVNLSGSSTTLSPGSVGLSVAATRALTGIASTVSAGTLTAGADASVGLTGTAITVSPGTITAGADASVALTGTAVTVSRGTVGFTVAGTQALVGASTTLSPGTVTSTTATSVAITGVSSTVSAGTVTPVTGTAVALTGSQTILSAGIVGISVAATQALTGTAVTVSAGTLVQSQPDVTVALTGAALVIAQGNIFIRGVWVPVVDTQTATWVPVNDANTTTWTQI